ncbi:hypothetical protein QQS21_008692 [Conoideocrella luteorostrata]|uniref:Uncharacterized protein n=1 Tax=Conoideocrella luteorostrata TaxID=1105319 RepID=A0AAJ0CII4_9HYPO|nr:hypothetical protein QQS21_008692 [Conoideocrella luteorostrata]
MDAQQDQATDFEPQRQYIKQEEITVNIFNRNSETSPSAFTDLSFDRLELGELIHRLNHAGHIVLSIAYNGNVADIVCVCKSDGWIEAVREQGCE